MPYGVLDAVVSDKEFMKDLLPKTLESSSKRLVGTTKPFYKLIAERKLLQDEIDKINIERIKSDKVINDIAKGFVNKTESKDVLIKKLKKEIGMDVFKAEKAINKIIYKAKTKDVDPFFIDLKFEQNNKIKALMFYSKFRDPSKLSKKEKEKAAKDLIAIDFSPNEEFIHEYKELRKKYN